MDALGRILFNEGPVHILIIMVISKTDKHKTRKDSGGPLRENSLLPSCPQAQPAWFRAITISEVPKPCLHLPCTAASIFYLLFPRWSWENCREEDKSCIPLSDGCEDRLSQGKLPRLLQALEAITGGCHSYWQGQKASWNLGQIAFFTYH